MDNERTYSSILKQLEPYYDKLNLFLTVMLLFLGLLMANRPGFLYAGLFDLGCSAIGVVILLKRKVWSLQSKMFITSILLILFALQSLIRGGFVGNGLLGLAMLIVIAMAFLKKRHGYILVLTAVLMLWVLAFLSYIGIFDITKHSVERLHSPVDWFYQSIALSIFAWLCYLAIFTIKRMLIESLNQLQEKNRVLTTQTQLLENQSQLLAQKAYIDDLTGLHNRAFLLDQVATLPTNGDGNDHWLVATIDIVNFRLINANFGITGGDAFLTAVASVAKSLVPQNGYFARIGSNEFALVVPDWTYDDLENMRIKAFLGLSQASEYLPAMPRQRFVIAYTQWLPNNDVNSFEEALNACGIAIKEAKQNKVSGIVAFHPKLYFKLQQETLLMSEIEYAIGEDRFNVVYQGKWSVQNQCFCGYEALCRWTTETGLTVSPMTFIPLINQSMYMVDFNRYIITKSIKEFEAILQNSSSEITLSLNITPLYFLNENFVANMTTALSHSILTPNQIILEITEDVFIDDYDLLSHQVKELTNLGFLISLDDFGSGYSSLSHISAIDINEIKVDKSIVSAVLHSDKSRLLFETIVDMAKKMGWHLVAEGVETPEELALLSMLGCDTIQGFLFSKPSSASDIINSRPLQ